MSTVASANRTVLAVRGLGVRRGTARILKDIDWRVEPGQHWVIIGANGSGKTSLLSALTAYLTPSSGTVEVLGQTYGRTDWRELRRSVGLVSSSIPQWIDEDVTAIEVVASGPAALFNSPVPLTSAASAGALAMLRRVEAGRLAGRAWAVLSQGERQRVLIARALLARPPLLILDEPCAGLDPLARARFVGFLDRLGRKRGGPALVLVTHHVEEIAPVFTHALLLRAGRVSAAGPIGETLTAATLRRVFPGADLRLRRDRSGGFALTFKPDVRARVL